MANISNNHPQTPIGLPNGVVLHPGQSVDIDNKDWTEMEKHPVIAHYVKEGALVENKSKPKPKE